jgi:hypothetical protein
VSEKEKWRLYINKLATSNKIGSAKERMCSRRKAQMDQCGDRFDLALQLLNEIKAGKFESFGENSTADLEHNQ